MTEGYEISPEAARRTIIRISRFPAGWADSILLTDYRIAENHEKS
jgi:hypothetical protein